MRLPGGNDFTRSTEQQQQQQKKAARIFRNNWASCFSLNFNGGMEVIHWAHDPALSLCPGERIQTENTTIISLLFLSFLSVTVTALSGMLNWYLFFRVFLVNLYFWTRTILYWVEIIFWNNFWKRDYTKPKNHNVRTETEHKGVRLIWRKSPWTLKAGSLNCHTDSPFTWEVT